jgi:hypothetical protein
MPPPDDLDLLSPAEVEGLVVQLWEQIIELRRLVAALRDENARLKSGAGRPNIKPNSKPGGMEQAIDSKPPGGSNERRRRSSTRAKLTINEKRNQAASAAIRLAFQGLYQLALAGPGRQGDNGAAVGFDGHFGPRLRRFVLAQYHQDKPRCRGWRHRCAGLASTSPNARWSSC